MPIPGVVQPNLISISPKLRLRAYDGIHDFALPWYQDPETVRLVDGKAGCYTPEKLKRMYQYLDSQGELYFIESWVDGAFIPIGDVTFWPEDLPIVIGVKAYRGRGIGKQVISALCQRAALLGYSRQLVDEIYDDNPGSIRCFVSLGFQPYEKTPQGHRYKKALSERYGEDVT